MPAKHMPVWKPQTPMVHALIGSNAAPGSDEAVIYTHLQMPGDDEVRDKGASDGAQTRKPSAQLAMKWAASVRSKLCCHLQRIKGRNPDPREHGVEQGMTCTALPSAAAHRLHRQ